jgi:choice-of-anchor A domain-containing protein
MSRKRGYMSQQISRNRLLFVAVLAALFVLGSGAAAASPLGIAANYNVFLGGSFISSNTDVAGQLAAGGNISVSSFGLATYLNPSANGTDTVIAGGTLNAPNSQLDYGNAWAANVGTAPSLANPSQQSVSTSGADPIAFATQMAALQVLSNSLAGISTNNSDLTQYSYADDIVATAPGLNVISVDNSFFSNNRELDVTLGANSTLLINVTGSSFNGPVAGIKVNGSALNGQSTTTAAGQILWNMPDVTSFTIPGGWMGTVLAPDAAVTTGYNQFSGTLIAGSYNGNDEFHTNPFTGTLPDPLAPTQVPEPGTFALIGTGLVGAALLTRRQRAKRASSREA